MKRILISFLLVSALSMLHAKPKVFTVTAPDKSLKVEVSVGDNITWSVVDNGTTIVAPSQIAMNIDNSTQWGVKPQLRKSSTGKINQTIKATCYKKSEVVDQCNTLTLQFKGDYSIEFRAYDNAAAYRFVSTKKGKYNVVNETAQFRFDSDYEMYCPYVNGSDKNPIEKQYFNSFENTYEVAKLSELSASRLMFLPVLVSVGDKKVCITESDLLNYPGMYLYNPDGATALTGNYAPVPEKVVQGGSNKIQGVVKSRKPYIAEIDGARAFPWRICIVADNDAALLNDDMVFRLSEPCALDDVSWIKPGKVAWDWWNNWGLYGVPFKAGINNHTYEYYIDFASRNGIEYVILDDGWSDTKKANLMNVIPEIDIKHLVDYGKQRGVGIVLWAGYLPVENDMENVFSHYASLGVKGFKIDFMNRDDQLMVNFYERAAAMAAKYHLMVDFHGAFKPSGLMRKYPNVLNYEGVHGLEQMKWSDADQVTYDVTIPFIRMVAGPMDYTQGAMINAQKKSYHISYSEPMSMGTRCHQFAMYVVFESPFNMLCDSPTNYEKEQVSTSLIAEIPTVWDETVALSGEVAKYAVIARRSGDTWYVGGLNGWEKRDIDLNLSFLPAGKYNATVVKDGFNAEKIAQDFLMENAGIISSTDKLSIHMATAGGFVVKFTPAK